MAKISRDKNSIRIRYTDPLTGKLKYIYPKLTWNPSNLKKAETIKNILEGDIADGTFDFSLEKYKYRTQVKIRESINTIFSELAKKWLSLQDNHPRTLRQKNYVINGFIKLCGDKPPHSYDYNDIMLFIKHEMTHYPKSFNRKINLIIDIFDYFVSCNLINNNIVSLCSEKNNVKSTRIRKEKIKIFTDEEILKIIEKCKEYYPEWIVFVKFLFNTGCRLGEAIALQWSDISFRERTLNFNNTFDNEFGFNTAKAGNQRTIELDDNTFDLLYCHYYADKTFNEFVFKYHGKAIKADYFRNSVWKNILWQAKISYRKPYTIRHTFITNLLKKGIDPITISTVTGHTPKTLLSEYAHVLEKGSLKDLSR